MIRVFAFWVPVVLLMATASWAEGTLVIQQDKAFSVDEISVKVGDIIRFRNEDSVVHNVFSRSEGNEFEIRAQLPGQESPMTVKALGTVKVRCAIHPEMELIIQVESDPDMKEGRPSAMIEAPASPSE